MPPKTKPLKAGETSTRHIAEIEKVLVASLGEGARYTQLPDPVSLEAVGVLEPSIPCRIPEFTLIVDTAEPDHLELVRRLRTQMNVFAVAQSMKRAPHDGEENFYQGDFAAIQWDDEHQKYIALVDVERKTINDMISSITDGRHQRQQAEHANSSARRHVYIVEGNVNELAGGKQAQWMRGVNSKLDHLAFDGPFNVRQINTHAELLPSLANLVRYAAKAVCDERSGVEHKLAHMFSGKKVRTVDTPEAVWSGMLQAVPGVSAAAAAAVLEQAYPTFMDFARAVVEAEGNKEKRAAIEMRLSEVAVKSQSGSAARESTRLQKRGRRIVDMAMGETTAPPPAPKRKPKPAPLDSTLWDSDVDEIEIPPKRRIIDDD